ncbi:MAG: NACHT domain-containing protein [Oscillatoriales cyanobacterium]|nr:MAG: NACHT domain-containing protein [Oscillatoriales cyanobacterium]
MAIELAFWGLTAAATSPAMEPFRKWLGGLAEDIAKDLLKDFVKDDLIIGTWQKLPLSVQGRAVGRSLDSFAAVVQGELDRLGYASDAYFKPLRTFTKDRNGAALLGQALNLRRTAPEPIALAELWDELGVRSLPEGFDWAAVAAAYRSAVQAIVRESAELRSIAQFELTAQLLEGQQATADLLADRLGPAVGCDLATYAERLRDRYSHLNLTSLDDRAYEDDRLRLWSVFVEPSARECRDYLPQQAELPKEWLAALGEEGLDRDPQQLERLRQSYLDQTPRPVLERIRSDRPDDRHLVILGDPGAGKSTLLRYLALDWAEVEVFEQGYTRSPAELDGAIVPLLVELQQYASDRQDGRCATLLDFMETGSFCAHLSRSAIDQRLKTGRAWLFLDGLDEVFEPAERQAITVEIARLAEQYPQAKIVVTSRVIGYKPYDLSGAEFRHFLLQDLDETQINQFISQWHQLVKRKDEQFLQLRRDRLARAVQQSKQIRELAGNPLLLTMMAILNLHQELPRDRFLLYEQAARVLLHQWDVERALESDPELATAALDFRDKQAMLRRVARVMQDSPKGLRGNLIREEDLEREFRDYLKTNDRDNAGAIAKRLIRQLRGRNFMLCAVGPGLYAFVHRTFLEYFCAASFLWDFKETQTLTIEALIAETFGKHWADESWHEVLRLIASELDQKFVEQIIEFLLSVEVDHSRLLGIHGLDKGVVYNLLLASDCLLELKHPSLNSPVFTKVFNRLKSEAQESAAQKLHFDAAFIVLNCVAKIGILDDALLEWFKSLLKSDNGSWLSTVAIMIIAQYWKDDPRTLILLKDRVRSDDRQPVKFSAIQAISKYWQYWRNNHDLQDDHEIFLILKDAAFSDKDSTIRILALQTIAKHWRDHPDVLPMIKDRGQSDESSEVRRGIFSLIADTWRDSSDTLTWLKDQMYSSQRLDIRLAAASQIVHYWKNDHEVFAMLKYWVQSNVVSDARQFAICLISENWKDESETLSLLCRIATCDPFQQSRFPFIKANPRYTAITKLLEIAPKNPQVIDLLRDRAANDPDDLLREWATEQLTKINPQ